MSALQTPPPRQGPPGTPYAPERQPAVGQGYSDPLIPGIGLQAGSDMLAAAEPQVPAVSPSPLPLLPPSLKRKSDGDDDGHFSKKLDFKEEGGGGKRRKSKKRKSKRRKNKKSRRNKRR
jgi:hypothetical protein